MKASGQATRIVSGTKAGTHSSVFAAHLKAGLRIPAVAIG